MNKQEEEALFWCGVLHPVLYGELSSSEVNEKLRDLSKREHCFPNGRLKKVSLKTLKRKYRKFKTGGFRALERKRRSDLGACRSVSEDILNHAAELKREQPYRSALMLNTILNYQHGKQVAPSTLYRHLKSKGVTKLKLGISKEKVRCRWTREHSNDLWLGDFEEGPWVMYEGEVVRTHLSAFIDCHSRFIVSGRYYFRQTVDILIDSLLRGWGDHGLPNEIYLDNAKVYHSDAYKAACFDLGIKRIYRKPYDPAPGGLIERFFLTVQNQFESEIRHQDICSLTELNEYFTAWLKEIYHQTTHSETQETPELRFPKGMLVKRKVSISKIEQFFWKRENRIVNKTFSDIQLRSYYYKVDAKLRGDKVEVRFDPYGDMNEVHVYSLKNIYLGKGVRHQRESGSEVIPEVSPKNKTKVLDQIKDKHRKSVEGADKEIDFRKMNTVKGWTFDEFTSCLAKYSGRKGSTSAFSSGELEQLRKAWARMPDLTEHQVIEAFSIVKDPSWIAVIQYLQSH